MTFHNVQFPTNISRGARGGPRRKTQIVSLSSGREERNASWLNSRRLYDVGYGIRSADDLANVVAFFEARNGQLFGFRFKDWADYKSCLPSANPSNADQPLGVGDGTTVDFQLVKVYSSGGIDYTREITKPVAGSVLIQMVGSVPEGDELVFHWNNPQSGGGGDWSNFSATGANSAVTGAGFSAAYEVGLSGAGRREQNTPVVATPGVTYRVSGWFHAGTGNTANLAIRDPAFGASVIKGDLTSPAIFQQNCGPISNVTATDLGSGIWKWSFDWVPLPGVNNARCGGGNLTSGETMILMGVSVRTPVGAAPAINWSVDDLTGIVTFDTPPVVDAVLTAGFKFDVPVRFDTDMMDVTLSFERQGTIQSIPLIEVRE